MKESKDSFYEWYLFEYPEDGEEAAKKWQALSKAIQMLQIIYKIPEDKIEKTILLCVEE